MNEKDKVSPELSTQHLEFSIRIPAIRFEGFEGEWSEKELCDFADVLDGDRGSNYPSGNNLQQSGHTLFLSASNVTKNGFKFDENQFITEEKSNSMGNGKLAPNDIVLTSRGSVGHIAWYSNNVNKKIPFARINSGMLVLRMRVGVTPCFVAQYLKSPLGKNKIDLISFGSAQPQLTKTSVENYSLNISTDQLEQTKIGNYFQQLDTLITQHKQKHEKLLNIKKALLEKMFPKGMMSDELGMMNEKNSPRHNSALSTRIPEIRFKGFSGEWEQYTLGDLLDITSASRVHKNEWTKSGVPFFRSSDVVADYKGLKNNKAFISFDLYEQLSNKSGCVRKNDLLVTGGGSIGIPYLVKTDEPLYFKDADLLWLKNTKGIDGYFIYIVFSTSAFRGYLASIAHIGTISHYTIEQAKSTPIKVPGEKEQTKIGTLFKKLDTLLTQHQTQLKKLNNIKQACLEKMFV